MERVGSEDQRVSPQGLRWTPSMPGAPTHIRAAKGWQPPLGSGRGEGEAQSTEVLLPLVTQSLLDGTSVTGSGGRLTHRPGGDSS